jgi:hypothetical protein
MLSLVLPPAEVSILEAVADESDGGFELELLPLQAVNKQIPQNNENKNGTFFIFLAFK